jgi:hypothetical protein
MQRQKINSWKDMEKLLIERIGKPDHDSGYTVEYLKTIFKGDDWDKFSDFMRGQTMMLDKGKVIIYTSDLANYFYSVETGKMGFFD